MGELFLSEKHVQNFFNMMKELEFEDFQDAHWRSLLFLISGDEGLFSVRQSLIDNERKTIKSDHWFSGEFSGDEQRLLALAYHLFTDMDYYKFKEDQVFYFSPLALFSGLDERSYQLATHAMDVRLNC